MIDGLTRKLVERGHDVTLYATGDSITSARLRSVYDHPSYPYSWVADEVHTTKAFQAADEFDIIHNHTYPGVRYGTLVATPTVTTLHNPLRKAILPMFEAFAEVPYVSISKAQQTPAPMLNYIGIVYNGVDTDELEYSSDSKGYLLHIGLICRRKGSHHAVAVARRLGLPLTLAGRVPTEETEFFHSEIEPYVDGTRIQYIGEVGGIERVELFQGAMALLVPIEWDEPFGLVMAEAMACGTPVVAFRRGSVPEIIIDGLVGFVVADETGMIDAVRRIDRIQRKTCRNHVVSKFSLDVMTDAYEGVYAKVLETSAPRRT